jgi:hypothetical protein
MNIGLEQYKQALDKERLIKPFVQIFDQSANKFANSFIISESLDDKDLLKAKEALGNLSELFTDLQINEIVTDIDCLVENWLNQFEKSVFDGKTLMEILQEGRGL